MISPGRLWWLLRRDVKRGWAASFHHYWTLPRIKEWQAPTSAPGITQVGVHVLTGCNDWPLAAWMLASWFHMTGHRWTVTIHDDGTLPEPGRVLLKKLLPDARFIEQAQADAAMRIALAHLPLCLKYRETHPLAKKIFDIPHFAQSKSFLILDSDLLFFRPPGEVLAWIRDESRNECWFNEDVQEGSLVPEAEAKEKLGVELWPRLNSGLCLLQRDAVDLEFCERALATTSILRGHIWRIEQTLFALCASRHGRGGLLPKTYEVSLAASSAPDAISRHYVGAVRDRFYADGLARLCGVLLKQSK